MKALVYKGPGKVALEETAKPVLKDPRDVLLRVTTTAICGSDLHALHGILGVAPGMILGHEFCGVVEEVNGELSGIFSPGDRVLAAPGVSCGRCPSCRRGIIAGCRQMAIFGGTAFLGNIPGGQAEYVRVPFADAALRLIPEGLDDEDVIFTGDILSTANMGVERLEPGDTVVVLGAGPVGLMAVALARFYGAGRIICVDPLEYRLKKALEMGADTAVNPEREDPVAAVYGATGGYGADLVVEAVGKTGTLLLGMNLVRFEGKLSVLGLMNETVEIPGMLLFKNMDLKIGITNPNKIDRLLAMIHSGKLDLRAVITHRMPLEQAEEAYRMFDSREDNVIKVLLRA
ncbi:MAG: zinc-dependent alcohol dehydrogenase [Desulfocucumaceae bacterium]